MNQIRYFSLTIFALLLIVVVSCDKNDAADNPLVGTWEYVESFEDFSMTVTITFRADQTGTSIMVVTLAGETESETTNFTYSTSGTKLTLTESNESTVLIYSVSGNKLTITEDGEQIVFTRK